MFNNLKIILINNNEILAFNDIVAGIFSTYRTTSNNAIHQKEFRKLNEEEIQKFLHEIDKSENEEFKGDAREVENILDKIVKYYPEVKYIVHGLNLIEAARRTPREERKDKRLLKRKMREKRKIRDKTKKLPKKEQKKEMEEVLIKPEKEKEMEEVPIKDKESGVKLLEDDVDDKGDAAKKAKEKWDEERKGWQTPKEQELSKVDKEKYTGFKGILFNIFKNLADPAKKAEREKLQKRLKKDWAMYKKNEKFLKENTELIDG